MAVAADVGRVLQTDKKIERTPMTKPESDTVNFKYLNTIYLSIIGGLVPLFLAVITFVLLTGLNRIEQALSLTAENSKAIIILNSKVERGVEIDKDLKICSDRLEVKIDKNTGKIVAIEDRTSKIEYEVVKLKDIHESGKNNKADN